jgi:SAM-dependent methyltransferase
MALSLLKRVHRRAIFDRRVKVLSASLASRIPAGASVLDIGCGDGTVGSLVTQLSASIQIRGIEIAPRPNCRIECAAFDGRTVPHPSASFDISMLVDVLHHAPDAQGIAQLLSEAARVSRRYILVKDHLSESSLDFKTLQLMDWVGNRPHGVVLPYSYQSREQWNAHFAAAGLRVSDWNPTIRLYPFPLSAVFGRGLHFIALLEKR